ncbi:uncharacterized protein BDR25DRAFT_361090 [Lindgomyces ingoldianus]|uniref:Uncharacterized protein n=1 Tax=Lindgomyces ingoldianus TaxID=673940 RepID=A0ACB6QD87_9PLEO|nr:uncharacterized protein BDR25DRAFT_361090 [Lindgomyces ingoldianus]KAF2464861.1 hypothetical protein BDR25DRAFT_361090 [Lindgomyces ingoldianus]
MFQEVAPGTVEAFNQRADLSPETVVCIMVNCAGSVKVLAVLLSCDFLQREFVDSAFAFECNASFRFRGCLGLTVLQGLELPSRACILKAVLERFLHLDKSFQRVERSTRSSAVNQKEEIQWSHIRNWTWESKQDILTARVLSKGSGVPEAPKYTVPLNNAAVISDRFDKVDAISYSIATGPGVLRYLALKGIGLPSHYYGQSQNFQSIWLNFASFNNDGSRVLCREYTLSVQIRQNYGFVRMESVNPNTLERLLEIRNMVAVSLHSCRLQTARLSARLSAAEIGAQTFALGARIVGASPEKQEGVGALQPSLQKLHTGAFFRILEAKLRENTESEQAVSRANIWKKGCTQQYGKLPKLTAMNDGKTENLAGLSMVDLVYHPANPDSVPTGSSSGEAQISIGAYVALSSGEKSFHRNIWRSPIPKLPIPKMGMLTSMTTLQSLYHCPEKSLVFLSCIEQYHTLSKFHRISRVVESQIAVWSGDATIYYILRIRLETVGKLADRNPANSLLELGAAEVIQNHRTRTIAMVGKNKIKIEIPTETNGDTVSANRELPIIPVNACHDILLGSSIRMVDAWWKDRPVLTEWRGPLCEKSLSDKGYICHPPRPFTQQQLGTWRSQSHGTGCNLHVVYDQRLLWIVHIDALCGFLRDPHCSIRKNMFWGKDEGRGDWLIQRLVLTLVLEVVGSFEATDLVIVLGESRSTLKANANSLFLYSQRVYGYPFPFLDKITSATSSAIGRLGDGARTIYDTTKALAVISLLVAYMLGRLLPLSDPAYIESRYQ